MNKRVRTRFAPSPTGFLHVGGIRTALFAWLLARQSGGKFILRFEDTDKKREVEGSREHLIKSLRTLGLEYDEGPDVGGPFAPYVQSERMGLYMDYAKDLIKKGKAYYCFCDKNRLQEVRDIQQASGMIPKYDGHCRNLSEEEIEKNLADGVPFVIRQRIPTEGSTSFNDEIFGMITVENANIVLHKQGTKKKLFY